MQSDKETAETDRSDAERVEQAQQNPDDAPPGVYTERDEDVRRITIVPEREVRDDEDPKQVAGQRRLTDGWDDE